MRPNAGKTKARAIGYTSASPCNLLQKTNDATGFSRSAYRNLALTLFLDDLLTKSFFSARYVFLLPLFRKKSYFTLKTAFPDAWDFSSNGPQSAWTTWQGSIQCWSNLQRLQPCATLICQEMCWFVNSSSYKLVALRGVAVRTYLNSVMIWLTG